MGERNGMELGVARVQEIGRLWGLLAVALASVRRRLLLILLISVLHAIETGRAVEWSEQVVTRQHSAAAQPARL